MEGGNPLMDVIFHGRRDKLAAVYFTVEEIYDQTPDLESAGRRIT